MLEKLLQERAWLLADGATGTNLFEMGLISGDAPEIWNFEEPDKIKKLHQGFTDAGADIILSNSFGGNRHRLKLHSWDNRVHSVNEKAATLAREVAEKAGRPVAVAGSVGPTGELLQPLGNLTFEEAREAFSEQIEGLKAGGVDVIWIETMSSADEINAAALAACDVGMPYCYTASFDTAGHTMMGLAPALLQSVIDDNIKKPIAIGANCGVGASDLLMSIIAMAKTANDTPLIAKANCGIPQVHGDHIHYSGTPEQMADYACLAVDAGARIIGGCCGTSYTHLAAMRKALDKHQQRTRPELAMIEEALGPLVSPIAQGGNEKRRGRRRSSS